MNESREMVNLTNKRGNRLPTEKRREFFQICAICSAALSALSCSILFNWTSPSIPILISNEYPDIGLEAASYLSVIPPIATIIVSPLYPVLLKKAGRKYTLLSVAGLQLLAFFIIAVAKSKWMFYFSRILLGVSDVFMFGSLAAYIAEVTTPKIRGTWGNIMMLFIFFGQFLVNAVGYYCSVFTTACIFSVVPIVFFFTFVFMPETPYYLIMQNKKDEAKKSLKRLRGKNDVYEELEQICKDLQRQLSDPGQFKDVFFVISNRKAVLILILTGTIQHFSGITAFAIYNQYIFKHAGQNINEGHCSMIFTAMLATATMCGPIVIKRLGRKLSMVFSCFTSGIFLLAEAVYFYFLHVLLADLSIINWFPIVGMVGYVISFSMGLSLVPTLLGVELFPPNMRGHAACVMNIIFSFYLCAIPKLFQFLMSSFSMYVPFSLFSVCCFVGTVLSYYIIPETTNKTLEEIQQLLKKTEN